jgi:hypothetical protein
MAANYTVTSIAEDQANDPSGTLVDVYDISFTVSGANGSFVVQVPQSGDVVAAASAAITAKADEVLAILAL